MSDRDLSPGIRLRLVQFATLRLLGGAGYLGVFDIAQRQSLASFAMRLHGEGYSICLTFAGEQALVLWLLVKGIDEPRWFAAATAR